MEERRSIVVLGDLEPERAGNEIDVDDTHIGGWVKEALLLIDPKAVRLIILGKVPLK
jgi:hypothetical protein